MQGKYRNPLKFRFAQAYRAALRAVLRGLVRWQPLDDPIEGYTLIIGSVAELQQMLSGNLACLARQRFENLDRIIVVVDHPRESLSVDIEARVAERFPGLPCRFIYYTPRQRRATGAVRWGWVNAWLSWSLGLAATRTRYAMLHDFDAMLLNPDFCEQRYRLIKRHGCEYMGIRYYRGNGVEASDELLVTIELMVDVPFVRRNFEPLALFNHVRVHNGRTVDFDTFLFAQSTAGRRLAAPIEEDDMVHPSQLICHYVMQQGGRGQLPANTSLVMIPYFMYIGGEDAEMETYRGRLEASGDGVIEFHGKPLNVRRLSVEHYRWIAQMTRRVEENLTGGTREPVERYLQAIGRCAGHAEAR